MPATPSGPTPRPEATTPAPATTPTPGVAVIPGGPGTGGSPGSGSGGPGAPGPGGAGDPNDPQAAGPFSDDSLASLVILGASISTVACVVAAFFILGRRRRRDEDEGQPLVPAPALAVAAVAAPAEYDVDPGTGGTDVDLPRWRRPSLMAARKSDPIRAGAVAGSMTFANGAAAQTGGERRRVRYRLVRLLDRPDEVAGATVGSLDEGDEVEVLEAKGMYRRVRAPDGRSGWLHKMTLGDVLETSEPEPEIERDVLLAYLSGRGKG